MQRTNIGVKCFICGETYGHRYMDMHMHSYFHHEAIEKIKGSEQLHKCWACDVTVMGLQQYKEHITLPKHRHNLFKLKHKRLKRKPLDVNYNTEMTDDEMKALYDLRRQNQSRSKKTDLKKCYICHHGFLEQEFDKHMHSVVHRLAVEQLKGSKQEHRCWACEATQTGIAEFKKHISTQNHKLKLAEFVKNRELGNNTVDYSFEFDELKDLCAQRDQEMFMKKREKIDKWKETKRQKTMKFIETKIKHYATSLMMNNDLEAEQFPPQYHFLSFWENEDDHPASTQHNQNLPTETQESALDTDGSNEPPVKRPCLERPSENIPQEMSAQGTLPNPGGNSTDVSVNDVTPETELPCAPGLVQSVTETNIPHSSAARGVCIETGSEAAVLNPPLHTGFKKPMLKIKRAASTSEQGTTRECMSEQEPNTDSMPPLSVLAEMFTSQASEKDLEVVENVQPHTARVQKNKSNECETERGETSQEHHSSSVKAISCNAHKTKKKTKKQDNLHVLNPEKNKICRKRKVNKLISLSLKEEELSRSLENVGEELFQAYSTLQNSYTEVQRLLAVKQEVTSEMASLRANRIKILQDMKDSGDQQEVLNDS
ncbi:zinc finger protein 106 [Puntigrus tetrazona]|uniref:zinc finger protein 106 n=1 Tax=Puntigrus tetrazona TaxID=1606681 RepID=UPI001C8A75A3|nr:zinc finger protein 106 [Puntigrus tetrazona]